MKFNVKYERIDKEIECSTRKNICCVSNTIAHFKDYVTIDYRLCIYMYIYIYV